MPRIIRRNTVIADHLVVHGYSHWLSNDLRGSGSGEIREEKLSRLGGISHGRKVVQPTKEELQEFYRRAEGLLSFETRWFDQRLRDVIAEAGAEVVRTRGYTCWAFAVLRNHVHALVRVHRDSGKEMWRQFAVASRAALLKSGLVPANHPVWSNRPYVVYKTNVAAVRKAVGYVGDNPKKHGLPPQVYPWVATYDGWPYGK